jgi:hypothetical protein
MPSNTTHPSPVAAARRGLCAFLLAWLRQQGDRYGPGFLVMPELTGQRGIVRAIREVSFAPRLTSALADLREQAGHITVFSAEAPATRMAAAHRRWAPPQGMPASATIAETADIAFF